MKVGDVILVNVGRKRRPAVVAKVKEGVSIVIPVTSSESKVNIGSYRSEFLGEGYFTLQILAVPLEEAEASKIGEFEDAEYLELIYKEIHKWLI